jgi:hypothetical protein
MRSGVRAITATERNVKIERDRLVPLSDPRQLARDAAGIDRGERGLAVHDMDCDPSTRAPRSEARGTRKGRGAQWHARC